MASSQHNNTHTEDAKTEQIITEFFAKSLHIILEARAPFMSSRNFSGEQTVSSPSSSSSSSSSVRPRDKWFNLALRECPAALENLDLWRQSKLEPIVVDVILLQKDWDSVNFSPKKNLIRNLPLKERSPCGWVSDQEEMGCVTKSEKIVERWVVQYECGKSRDSGSLSRRSSNILQILYKKSILLLRSLYSTVRLLPAYKIFRDLNSSGHIRSFALTHRISSFVEPFTRKEEADMKQFVFTSVDTSCGRLCLSVMYHSSVSELGSESSTPMSPQFIPDYVGSPLAGPLRTFPSLPVAHGSPSSLPFSRRHSWSFDQYKASPPSISYSPSPTHSEPRSSISNPNSRGFPSTNLPPHPEISSVHKKNMSFDEYIPSPNFTPSPSPSPPIYNPEAYTTKALFRCESAPVKIPGPKLGSSPVLTNKQCLPPSPSSKGSRASKKTYSLGKDGFRKYYEATVSSSKASSQILFSRSSSHSFQDDFDDPEFPCPFDVEDDDGADGGGRPKSFEPKSHQPGSLEAGAFPIKKSQDAAVGALVHMLKKAKPLCQDYSTTLSVQENEAAPSSSGVSSSRLASKTTADAFEELQGYKEMVQELLRKSGKPSTGL